MDAPRAGCYKEFEQSEAAGDSETAYPYKNVPCSITSHARQFEHPAIGNRQNGTNEIDAGVQRHDYVANPVRKRQKCIIELVLAAILS